MARVLKGRRVAYDNIAVGEAITTVERTISGDVPVETSVIGNGENIEVAGDYGEELIIAAGVSDLLEGEHVAVGG